MVNVNKNIVPGKAAEKAEEKAPMRRPRNKALNSSKKLPDSIKERRKQKLNCSRAEVINQLVNEEQIYTQEEAEELCNDFEAQTGATIERLASTEEVDNYDGEFWATKDGVTQLWCRGNGFWYPKEEDYESDGSLGVELANKNSSTMGVPELDTAVSDFLDKTNAEFDSQLRLENSSVDGNTLKVRFADNSSVFDESMDKKNEKNIRSLEDRIYDFAKELGKKIKEFGPEVDLLYLEWPESYYQEWYIDDLNSSKKLDCAEGSKVVKCLPDDQMADSIRNALEIIKDDAVAEHAYPYENDIPFFVSRYDPQLHTVRVSSADNESWAYDGVSDKIEVLVRYAKMYAKWLNEHPEYLDDDDLDSSKKLNCSEDETADVTVTTESGNEISIKEIKVVQNPSTNELALYVPENEDDEIPDGFVVLGDVVATATAEAPEEEVKEELEETGEEEPEEGELDASKKKN